MCWLSQPDSETFYDILDQRTNPFALINSGLTAPETEANETVPCDNCVYDRPVHQTPGNLVSALFERSFVMLVYSLACAKTAPLMLAPTF
ncbi:MAG TPA: hypothetical protein VEZ90_15850 [Blastocatellia bacterium]|nr:hypothetical protein [Blastocatellia bacterium]